MFCWWPLLLIAACGCGGSRGCERPCPRRCFCNSNPLEHLPTNVYHGYEPHHPHHCCPPPAPQPGPCDDDHDPCGKKHDC